MIAEIGLGLSVVSAGLWAGLLLTVTTILHPLYAPQDARGFATDMRRFLPIARRSPTNYILVCALLVAPIIALVGLRHEPTQAPFVLTAAGFAATVAGPLLTSRLFAEPNYGRLAYRPRPVLPPQLDPGGADVGGVRVVPHGGVRPPQLMPAPRAVVKSAARTVSRYTAVTSTISRVTTPVSVVV